MNEMTIRKATIINFIARYSSIFIQVIYSAILARILTPHDFGVVAIMTVFSSFFSLLANMGIGTAVIQDKTLTIKDNESLYSFTHYLGIALMVAFTLFSFPIASFYNNPVYKPLGAILSFSLFFNILNTVPNAILSKEKRFLTIGIRTIIVTIISSVIAILFAMAGFRYYSIVIYSVISSVLLFAWNKFNVHLHFHLQFDWSRIGKIKNYASFQFAFDLINYFSRNLDNLLIGKFMGDVPLAYYNKSYTLMLYPISNLTNVITPVLHPILSEYQNDKQRIFIQYMKVVKILSLLGVFITPFCFFAANDLILLVFGDQWTNSIPCFRILALSIWAQMVTSSTGSIFQSLGKTKLLFKTGLITTFITIIAIVVGVASKSIETVSLAVTIAYNIHFFIGFYFLIHYAFEKPFLNIIGHLWKDWIIMGALFMVLRITLPYMPNNLLLSLVLKLCISTIIFILGTSLTCQNGVLKRILGRG